MLPGFESADDAVEALGGHAMLLGMRKIFAVRENRA
jgi:hypothetical protein